MEAFAHLSAVTQGPDSVGITPEDGTRKCLDIIAVADSVLQSHIQGLHRVLWNVVSTMATARAMCSAS